MAGISTFGCASKTSLVSESLHFCPFRSIISDMKVFMKLSKEIMQYKLYYIVGITAVILATLSSLVAPSLLSEMTGVVSAGVGKEELNAILVLAAWLTGLYLLKWLARFVSTYMLHIAAWRLADGTRIKLYDRIQTSSLDYIENRQSGELLARVINDVDKLELLYAHVIPEFLTNALTFVGVLGVLLYMNWKLALVTAIIIPLVVAACVFYSKKVRPNFKSAQKLIGTISAEVQDNIQGIREVQSFGQQEREHLDVKERTDNHTRAILKALKASGIFHPLIEFLSSLGTVAVVAVGGYLAYSGGIDVSEVVAFLLYLSLLFTPMEGMARLMENAEQALAAGERILEVLEAPITITDSGSAVDIGRAEGKISFENVSFSYGEGKEVLSDISFVAEPGKTVALVGATGAGKTTITKLISRFYDPTEGSVKLDDVDLKMITLKSLRSNISPVLQDTFLFTGTVAENIAYAKPDAKIEEIVAAATKAQIHDDIMEMPDGYDTTVGERGMKLSGGQKQRIQIARAILRESPIIILDEATASVDSSTESKIQSALGALAGSHTVIVIAHRLSTVVSADEILVLDSGRIVERGTHPELLEKGGLYKTLYEKSVKK